MMRDTLMGKLAKEDGKKIRTRMLFPLAKV